jgi:hypothetical protein
MTSRSSALVQGRERMASVGCGCVAGMPGPGRRCKSLVAFRGPPRYLAGMDRLTPDQARKIHDALGPATGYLWRLLDRLYQVGLDVRDPELTRLVAAARDAMHSLTVELHY